MVVAAVHPLTVPWHPTVWQSFSNFLREKQPTQIAGLHNGAGENAPDISVEDGTSSFSTVKCKLARVCRLEPLYNEIQRSCLVLKQVQLEAYHVLNLHLLRCLEHDEPQLPQFSQTFYYRCCSGVLEGDFLSKTIDCRDARLNATLVQYREMRRQISGYLLPRLDYAGASLNEIARQMKVNCTNMVVVNFYKWFRQYIALKEDVTYAGAETIARKCCVRRNNNTFTQVEQRWRTWLGRTPTDANLERHIGHFLRKIYIMASYVELKHDEEPDVEGRRIYLLLPAARAYVAAHMTINLSTLHGVCARNYLRNRMDPTRRNPLRVPMCRNGTMLVSRPYFQHHRSDLLRRAFAVDQFETVTRNFANQVTSNGYEASILLTRPMSTTELAATYLDHEHVHYRDADLYSLPTDYQPTKLVGMYPGMRMLCSYAELNVEHPVEPLPEEALPGRDNVHVGQFSTREYHHMAGMHKRRFWYNNLCTRYRYTYAAIVRSMPTFKTTSYATYLSGLQYFWCNVKYLISFCAKRCFRKWRFFIHGMKAQVLDKLARRVVPDPGRDICVAYGAWSQRHGSKGHPTGPVKRFKRGLRKRATVIDMDEFRTSKLCSCCHQQLTHHAYRHLGDDNEPVAVPCYTVLRCNNRTCQAEFWDRDVNASRNILYLLLQQLRDPMHPPLPFRRPVRA